MNIIISKPPAGGVIPAIPSKSAAHRIMIAAALSGISPGRRLDGLSEDITATKECLASLMKDAGPQDKENKTEIKELYCRESGSTLRFLVPVAAALGSSADFYCEGRLPDRPMQPLIESLAAHGAEVTGRNPKKVRGRLKGGSYCLAGNVSSQYVTGLLLALPLADEDSTVTVCGRLQSRPYVDMTLEVLKKAGIRVGEKAAEKKTGTGENKEDTVFMIPGRQQYVLPDAALDQVEGDWSNAAFWLVMDALSEQRLSCSGLDPYSAQGDRAIRRIVQDVQEAGTERYSVDVSDVPDLVPAIAVLACGRPAGSRTEITGAERLRYKESDRLRSVSTVLTGLGADITEHPDGLTVCSSGRLSGGTADGSGDHRIVMMAAAAACISDGPVEIRGAEAVRKSYPHFFEDYTKLGGEVEWL